MTVPLIIKSPWIHGLGVIQISVPKSIFTFVLASKASIMSSDSSPIYFWRVNEEPYGCFSQWYSSTFAAPAPASAGENAATLTFRTAEQYMMYHKAILFKDQKVADEIIREPDARKQKALGRRVRDFDEEIWNKHREKIVEEGNWWKFTQSKKGGLKLLLLETVDRELIEVCAVY